MQTCELPRHAPAGFRRHEPENTVLYQIVREYVNTFFELADARSGEGRGLPRYVKNAFLRYLECGILAHGFARTTHLPFGIHRFSFVIFEKPVSRAARRPAANDRWEMINAK